MWWCCWAFKRTGVRDGSGQAQGGWRRAGTLIALCVGFAFAIEVRRPNFDLLTACATAKSTL